VFTGLVQAVGVVAAISEARLEVIAPEGLAVDDPIREGESIAINGCCLTVLPGAGLKFDLSEETLRRTSFHNFKSGSSVNLERALRVGDRLGGHLVQGHVDAVGTVVERSENQTGLALTIRAPSDGARYLVDKGSVTVDGVSLTVVNPRAEIFDLWLIPHTLAETNLASLHVGDLVNLEYDVLAKHVESLLRFRL